MSTLYLLRHGQASFGADDYDWLSPLGLRQALSTGASLAARDLRFDEVFVGPRRRHLETAEALLAAMPGAGEPRRTSSLDEFAEGDALMRSARRRLGEVGWPQDRAESTRLYGEEIRRWAAGDDAIAECTPVESFHQSVTGWLHELVGEPTSGRRLLAVTSAGTIAVLIAEVLGLPRTRLAELLLVLDNAALSELVFQPGRISLRSFNSTYHLPADLMSRI
ncbi:histidine phosphatase family protein [Metapseudomonas boanensis]|uniref:Histidine phosphatase family protein n=1 Tax=Metapseudomonas boanensis TaxID=2822138 RepID=A0ABS5XG96_9GAMM|nr:histidine phosphatase family protein [Pseudomonas boanensis]MBT8766713.1 histidine phosphatase family protein [Pseudomonas boanensis]